MADIKKIKLGETTYNIVDAGAARIDHLHDLKTFNGQSLYGTGELEVKDAAANEIRHVFSEGYYDYTKSTREISWVETLNKNTATTLRGIAYGKNQYVAVGANNSCWVYEPAIAEVWVAPATSFGSSATSTFTGIAYGNGLFVVVEYITGSTGAVWATENPKETWNKVYEFENYSLEGIRYINNAFYAVGTKGLIMRSDNGADWQVVYDNTKYLEIYNEDCPALIDITYGNGLFVAGGRGGVTFTSTNGRSWTKNEAALGLDIRVMGYANGVYLAGTKVNSGDWTTGGIFYSTDGRNWSLAQVNSTAAINFIRGFAYHDNRLLACGYKNSDVGQIYESIDEGRTWQVLHEVNYRLWQMCAADDRFIVIGDAERILALDLGIPWQASAPLNGNYFYKTIVNLSNGTTIESDIINHYVTDFEVPQADWTEEDETSSSYIKNKPTILTEENILALFDGTTITKTFTVAGRKEDKVFEFSAVPGDRVIVTADLRCNVYPHTASGSILSGISCAAGQPKELLPTEEWTGLAYYIYDGVQSEFTITVEISGLPERTANTSVVVSKLGDTVAVLSESVAVTAMNQSVLCGGNLSQLIEANSNRDTLTIIYPVKKDTNIKILSPYNCTLYPHNATGHIGTSISCESNVEINYVATEDLVGFAFYKWDGVSEPFTINFQHMGVQTYVEENSEKLDSLSGSVKSLIGDTKTVTVTTNKGDSYLSIEFPVKAGVEVSIATTQSMRLYAHNASGTVVGNVDIKNDKIVTFTPTEDIIGFGNYTTNTPVNAEITLSYIGEVDTLTQIKDDFLGSTEEWTISGNGGFDKVIFPTQLKLGQKVWIDTDSALVLYPHTKAGAILEVDGITARRISLIAGSRYEYEAEADLVGFAFYASTALSNAVVKITKAPIDLDYVEAPNLPSYYFPYLKNKADEIRDYWSTCSANTDAFFFITDMHYDEHMRFNAGNSLEMIKYLRTQLPIPILLQGGDFFNWGLYANIMPDLRKALGGDLVYSAYGNHEFMYEDPYGAAAIYYHTINNNLVFGDETRTFGYADIPGKQLRIVVLGSYGKYDGENYDKIYDYESQYNWFTTEALNLPNGYNAIILTHDLYTCSHSEPKLGLTSGAARYVDFINQNADKVICVLNGHTHADRIHYGETGVPYIVSQGDTLKEAGVGPVPREVGTTTEQHFEVCLIDRENHTIKLFSIGSQCQVGEEEAPGELGWTRDVTFVANAVYNKELSPAITVVDTIEDIGNDESTLYRYTKEDGVLSNLVEVISEFHEGGASNVFAKTTTANNNSLTSVATFSSHFENTLSNFVTIDSLSGSVYTYNNNYPMNGIRLGTKTATGTITATLLQEGSLTFHRYFGFNGSTGEITSYDASASVVIDGTTYNFTADDEDLVIPVSAGTHTIENVNGRILFLSFVFGGEAYYTYENKHLARQEDLDARVEELKTTDTKLEDKIKTVEKATQTNSSAIESVNAKLGSVQIFDVTKLPKASMEHLSNIYRCQGILNQCIQLGDGEHKDFVFNLSGTSEIKLTNPDTVEMLYKEIDKSFNEHFEITEGSKMFRNNGNIKLGSSSATGYITISQISNVVASNIKVGLKAYNANKSIFVIKLYYADGSGESIERVISDNTNETIINLSEIIPNESGVPIDHIFVETCESFTADDGETTYADSRGCVTRLIVDFGEVTYEWNAIGVTEKTEYQIKVTYDELKALRDNAQLIPGQQYRIIDYITTTSRSVTRSAGHQFDIIVTADSNTVLNENARATWPEPKDEWLPGITAEDVHILYKLTDRESDYHTPMEEIGAVGALTTITNSAGQTIPAFIELDPDGNSGYQNSLVSIKYTLTDDSELLYEGPGTTHMSDIFVELGSYGGVPALYKTDPTNGDVEGLEDVDYNDIFIYKGDFELDGVTYNLWDKYDYEDDIVYCQVLTDVVVVDNKFIITQEELINSIKWQYQPSPGDTTYIYAGPYTLDGVEYDQWFETYADPGMGRFGRLTNKVVKNSDRYFDKANLAAWEIKYCLDNDTKRFDWASNAEVASIDTSMGGASVNSARMPEWDSYIPEHLEEEGWIYAWDGGTVTNGYDTVTGYGLILTKVEYPVVGVDEVFYTAVNTELVNGKFTEKSHGTEINLDDSYHVGKGVIYYMKDEHNNECPYDFKNIQFLKQFDSSGRFYDNSLSDVANDYQLYVYTFSILNRENELLTGEVKDHSVEADILLDIDGSAGGTSCSYNNRISNYSAWNGKLSLPANVMCVTPNFYNTSDEDLGIVANVFEANSTDNCLRSDYGSISNNFFGADCTYNIVEDSSQSIESVHMGCTGNVFKWGSNRNIVRGNHNTLGSSSSEITLLTAENVIIGNNTWRISFRDPIKDSEVANSNFYLKVQAATPGTLQNITIGKGVSGSYSFESGYISKILTFEPNTSYETVVRAAKYKEIILDEEE